MSQEKGLSPVEIAGIATGVTISFIACCWWGIRKCLGISKAKNKGSSDLELTATPSDPSDSTLASTPRSQPRTSGVFASNVSHQGPYMEVSTAVVIVSSESFSVSSPVIIPEHGSLAGSPRASNSDQQHNLPYVPLALRNSSPYRGPLGSPRISGEETQGADGSPRFSGVHRSLPASPRTSTAELPSIQELPGTPKVEHSSLRRSPPMTPRVLTIHDAQRPSSVSNAGKGLSFFQRLSKDSPRISESSPSGEGSELQLQRPNAFENEVEELKKAMITQRQKLEEARHMPLNSVVNKLLSLGQDIHQLEVQARELDSYMNREKKNSRRPLTSQELEARIEELDGFEKRLTVLAKRAQTFDTYTAEKEKGKKALQTSHSSPSLGYADNQARL